MPYNLDKMCRHAIDRSSGQLLDINLEFFLTDDLLNYILFFFFFFWLKGNI
jgi:hypothetical protein